MRKEEYKLKKELTVLKKRHSEMQKELLSGKAIFDLMPAINTTANRIKEINEGINRRR